MNKGSTVFSQIMSLIPRRQFNNCVTRYNGNYRVRNFSCHDQFLVMCLAQYANKGSLRDIEASLTAVSHKSYMNGISYAVPRNTLAKANKLRDWRIYADLGKVLIDKVRPLYADAPFWLDLDNTEASVHDVKMLDDLCVEMGAIYLLDKGYIDFFRLFNRIHRNGAFFVTRAKDNIKYDVLDSRPIDKNAGIMADEVVKLTTYKSSRSYPEELRLVTYEDFSNGKVYRFLTNHMGYEALTVAELYRERWNVELFFKWIKQHLHIGTSQNAVYTQIWIAVCAFLLLAFAKKKFQIEQSLHTISQTVGFALFEKIPINQLFNKK